MSRIIVIAAVLALSVGVLALLAYGRTIRAGEQALRGPYVGSYAANLTSAQAATRGDSRLAGRFTLVLRRDGTYADWNPLGGRDEGRVAAVGGDRLRFYEDRHCKLGGLERPQGGIYRWSLNGRRLTLHLVNEGGCTGRTDTLTFPVWSRR
ncbi:MAG TPA: hypothetical protein VGJ40_01170 [Gaiellaceae bacterium]